VYGRQAEVGNNPEQENTHSPVGLLVTPRKDDDRGLRVRGLSVN